MTYPSLSPYYLHYSMFDTVKNNVLILTESLLEGVDMDAEEFQLTTSGLGDVGQSGQSKLLVNKDTVHVRNEENYNVNSSKKILQYFDQINQQRSLDVTKQGCVAIPYVKRRDRRPNSRLK
ncbi:Hypothetical predicted protein [Olea europaea subsp. europaea]|uniref:Uncharacterized protein n=1 Tax=Olea europaea subsp. europaea TaxID=158383 RepID=A0A8S0TBP1_OLEEU|nr:Hypothetical predicted protein [Olea europaea subsp. europaea]